MGGRGALNVVLVVRLLYLWLCCVECVPGLIFRVDPLVGLSFRLFVECAVLPAAVVAPAPSRVLARASSRASSRSKITW